MTPAIRSVNLARAVIGPWRRTLRGGVMQSERGPGRGPDSCERFEHAEAGTGRPRRRSLSGCLGSWSALSSLSSLCPFVFCEARFLPLSLIIFPHSSPYNHLFENPTALLALLRYFYKAHFSHEI